MIPLVNSYVFSQNCCDWSEMFCSPEKLCLLTKHFCFPDKLCVCLQNYSICSQNICVLLRNFTRETSAFNTLQFAHTTFVMDIKWVGSKNYISVLFKILRKVFWGKQKALWENAKALKFFLQSPFHLGSIFEITVLLFCFLLNLLIC